MKEITVKVELRKFVSDGFKDEIRYVAEDGREFQNKIHAIQYEAKMLSEQNFKNKYQVTSVYLDRRYDVIFIKEINEVTVNEILSRYEGLTLSELTLGVNLIYVDDSGDYTSSSAYSIKSMILERENELKKLKEIEHNYIKANNAKGET